MVKRTHHVIAAKDGWSVVKGGAKRASRSFEKQAEALEYARELSKNQHSELYIHKRDGSVQNKESYSTTAASAASKAIQG